MQRLLPFLVFVATSLFGQSPSTEISIDAINFIKTAFHDKRDNICLSASCENNFTLNKIKESLFENDVFSSRITYKKDSITIADTVLILSEPEKKFIDSCLNSSQSYKWTKEIVERFELPNLKLVNFDTINIGSTKGLIIRYYLLPPILIRDNSVCIFYSAWHYPDMPLGGEGELVIYKKGSDEWKRYTISQWNN